MNVEKRSHEYMFFFVINERGVKDDKEDRSK